MRLTTSAALALQLCSLPQPPLLTPRTAPARIRACEPADASWDDVPWEDGPLGGGVLLDVDDAAERLHPELGALVEQDCMALLQHAKQPDAQLSLTLCDDVAIHALNSEWRGKDRPTDVLSFPLDDDVMLGDIVISVETAARQAAERGYGVRDEVRVLLVHGLLHLLGYDHELSSDDHAEHAAAEQKLMRALGWDGDGLVAAAGGTGT